MVGRTTELSVSRNHKPLFQLSIGVAEYSWMKSQSNFSSVHPNNHSSIINWPPDQSPRKRSRKLWNPRHRSPTIPQSNAASYWGGVTRKSVSRSLHQKKGVRCSASDPDQEETEQQNEGDINCVYYTHIRRIDAARPSGRYWMFGEIRL